MEDQEDDITISCQRLNSCHQLERVPVSVSQSVFLALASTNPEILRQQPESQVARVKQVRAVWTEAGVAGVESPRLISPLQASRLCSEVRAVIKSILRFFSDLLSPSLLDHIMLRWRASSSQRVYGGPTTSL